MILADMMAPEGRIFFKSEWGPIDDNWPCLSYTSRRTQTFLQRRFGDGDILLYVGTQNPKSTHDKAHRKKLLSALNLDPTHTFPTVEGITAESWARSQRENPGKFGLSLRVTRAANFVRPRASGCFQGGAGIVPAARHKSLAAHFGVARRA